MRARRFTLYALQGHWFAYDSYENDLFGYFSVITWKQTKNEKSILQ